MKIKKLECYNFRCFEHYELTLSDRFTLLIGDNGSGKTAVLDALALAISEFIKCMPPDIRESSGLRLISVDDIQCSFTLMGQNVVKHRAAGSGYIKDTFVKIDIKGILNKESYSWHISNEGTYYWTQREPDRFRHKKIFMATVARLIGNITNTDTLLPILAHYGTGRLWQTHSIEIDTLSPDSRLLGYQNCLNSASNLEQLLRWFKTQELAALQKQERRHVLEAVREAIISMIPDAQKVWWDIDWDRLLIETVIQGQTQTLPFHLLSDGYRTMLGMAADIAYRMATLNPQLEANAIKQTEGIVLIDELDLHLHPKWQRQVVGRLLATFPNVQFVASSHSPFIIQSLYHRDDVLLWDLATAAPLEIDSKSIEDIAEHQQGVEIPQQSQRFLDMEQAAEAYYSALQQIPSASEEEKQRLRQRLDELLLPYSDDPAFQAFLKMERLARDVGH